MIAERGRLTESALSRDAQQRWGMQIRRHIQRRNEEVQWAFWTKTETGGAGRFGHLDGIRIGQRVRVVFKPTEGGPPVPTFTPA